MKFPAALLLAAFALAGTGADAPRKLSGRVVDFNSDPARPVGLDSVKVLAYNQNKTHLLAEAQTDGAGNYELLGVGIGDAVLIEHYKEYYLDDPQIWADTIRGPKITIRMSRKAPDTAYYVGMGMRMSDLLRSSTASSGSAASSHESAFAREWRTFRGFDYSPSQREIVRGEVARHLTSRTIVSFMKLDASITAEQVKDKEPQVATDLAQQEGVLPNIYFALGDATLTAEAAEALTPTVWFLEATNFSVVVEGFTDASGSSEYNMVLSAQRARAVSEYLIARGLDRNRVQVHPYGETRPVCNEMDEACLARNRWIRQILVR